MSIRAKSHTDLQMAEELDDGLYKSFSTSSSNVNRGGRFRDGGTEEVKVLPRPFRRPVRAVRPVSAVSSNGSFLQINHLQGELVRKRKVGGKEGWKLFHLKKQQHVDLTADFSHDTVSILEMSDIPVVWTSARLTGFSSFYISHGMNVKKMALK